MKAGLLGLLATLAFGLYMMAFPPPASAQAISTVIPIVNCVEHDPAANTLAVHFGYINTGPNAVMRSYGSANRMSPGEEILPKQPFYFLPGRRDYVWNAEIDLNAQSYLTWFLSQVPATATNDPALYCDTDVSLSQSAAPDPVLAGSRLTYTLKVTNDSRFIATGVTIRDQLPAGVELVSAEASQGICSGADGTVTCEIGTLGQENRDRAPGVGPYKPSAEVTIVVEPRQPGTTLFNTASVSTIQADEDASDNIATTRVNVIASPAATTGLAGALSPVSANLSAFVDPNGFDTTYHFEYGTTDAYGKKTAEQPAGSGVGPDLAQTTLDGLRPNTTYHYRVVATNEHGTVRGADRTFTTSALMLSNLTLSAKPAALERGKATTLAGALKDPSGTALAGKRVTLHRKPAGANSFVPVRATTTGPDGAFVFRGLRPKKTTFYQVRFAGNRNDGLKTSSSPVRRVVVRR